MLMLELPATNGTLESRFFATFHPDMILQGTTPEITFATLKADPHLPRASWKRRSVSHSVILLHFTLLRALFFPSH